MSEIEYKITCTSVAITEAKKQIAKRNRPETKGIRIGLGAGKCNGFYIIFEFCEQIKEGDKIFIFDGLTICVDLKSIIYLNGTQISYETGLMGHGFKFSVPGETGTCGCGESISF